MAATSETTYTWSCDLCGAPAGTNKSQFSTPDSLHRFKFAVMNSSTRREHPVPVDLCGECMKRPITDLAAHLDSKAVKS
jgi:hypothetical protein